MRILLLIAVFSGSAFGQTFQFVAPAGDFQFQETSPGSVTKSFEATIVGDGVTPTEGFAMALDIPQFGQVVGAVNSAALIPGTQNPNFFTVDLNPVGAPNGVTIGCVYDLSPQLRGSGDTPNTMTFPLSGRAAVDLTIALVADDMPTNGDIVVLTWSSIGNPTVQNVVSVNGIDDFPVLVNGSIELINLPDFVRGDANSNGFVSLPDAIFILNWLFLGGPEPVCLKSIDTDNNGSIAGTGDVIYLLNVLFATGTSFPPLAPFPNCGQDPTPNDGLSCNDPTFGC